MSSSWTRRCTSSSSSPTTTVRATRSRGATAPRVWRPGSYWPGDDVAGIATAQFDGRFKGETPLWIPAHAALIFADAVVADRAGNLRIWETDWYDEYTIPAMRRLLEL